MLIVVAECRILPEFWQDFEEEMMGLVTAVRSEAGCNRYEILTSVEEPGLFIILEEWVDESALQAHLQTIHMVEHIQRSQAWQQQPVRLSKYLVSESEKIVLNETT